MALVEPGSQLDHYSVGKMVARTDTAAIFQGTDRRTGQSVALKVPHPEVEGDSLFYQRFRREQEICEKLDHPSVVKGFRDDKRSEMYIVMELAQGLLLRQILSEQGNLPVERAIAIAQRICEALDYIHSQGIVHRDLKPENIFVDVDDRVKLIDFGIAGQRGARRLTFGKLSQVMGTPDYIAPEQVKGKRGDGRADIYALGIILYEMVTGRTPFGGGDPYVVMNQRLVSRPAPLQAIDPGISSQLQEIVYRALERKPENRYASAREFAHDLEHPEQVKLANRPDLRSEAAFWRRPAVLYGTLVMLPVAVFGLLLFVARHS